MNTELINKLVSEDICNSYDFTADWRIKGPGKFEGESIATLYYYDAYMNGEGPVFQVTDDERLAFNINSLYVYLEESSNGFVSLVYFDTLDAAQQAENMDWENEWNEFNDIDDWDGIEE